MKKTYIYTRYREHITHETIWKLRTPFQALVNDEEVGTNVHQSASHSELINIVEGQLLRRCTKNALSSCMRWKESGGGNAALTLCY